jgi:hypothetical protein
LVAFFKKELRNAAQRSEVRGLFFYRDNLLRDKNFRVKAITGIKSPGTN